MADLLCLGEPLYELNQSPETGLFKPGHGGDVANVAYAATLAGVNSAMLTALGDDPFGHSFLNLWKNIGISTEYVELSKKYPTGMYFVHHSAAGHDFSYRRAGSAACHFNLGEKEIQAIKDAKILHISAISQAISSHAADVVFEAMDIAKAAGTKISYDTNLRLKLWPLKRATAIINETIPFVDYLLPGDGDAEQITNLKDPQAMIEHFLTQGAKTVALTMGEKGTLINVNDTIEHIAPFKVDARDATGAGDTFDGNFLARILQGDSLTDAAQYANAAAAMAVEKYGAIEAMPNAQAVIEFLQSRGNK